MAIGSAVIITRIRSVAETRPDRPGCGEAAPFDSTGAGGGIHRSLLPLLLCCALARAASLVGCWWPVDGGRAAAGEVKGRADDAVRCFACACAEEASQCGACARRRPETNRHVCARPRLEMWMGEPALILSCASRVASFVLGTKSATTYTMISSILLFLLYNFFEIEKQAAAVHELAEIG